MKLFSICNSYEKLEKAKQLSKKQKYSIYLLY